MQSSTWTDVFAVAGLLSKAFVYPDDKLSEALADGKFARTAHDVGLDVGLLGEYEGHEPQAIRSQLRMEASRLFHSMPTAVVSPYGGVWHSKDHGSKPMLGFGVESLAVESFCADCGLGHPNRTNEPLDHIATELELLQYLAGIAAGAVEFEDSIQLPGGCAENAFGEFIEQHLAFWVPRFCNAVAQETTEPFYSWASQNLLLFIEQSSSRSIDIP